MEEATWTLTWGKGRPQCASSTRRTLQCPAEALSLPLGMGVYCPAIWRLRDKFTLLNLSLRPFFLHSHPCSLPLSLPSLLLVYINTCLQTHMPTSTHADKQTHVYPLGSHSHPPLLFKYFPSRLPTLSIHPHKGMHPIFCTPNAFCPLLFQNL